MNNAIICKYNDAARRETEAVTGTRRRMRTAQRESTHGRIITGTVTMATESSKNDAITSSRMNFPGYVRHVTIFS